MYKQESPFTVQFGIVDGCNNTCPFCGMMGREKRFNYASMDLVNHVTKILSDSRFGGRIRLDLHGEPTLHPEFFKIVKHIHDSLPNCHITLFTNGVGIYRLGHTLDMYFACGIGDIIFDVYSNTLEEYERSEVPGYPLTVVNNSKTALFVKKKRVLVNLPIETQQEIVTRKFVNHCGAGAPQLRAPISKRCAHPFRDLTINSYGEVILCCNDFRAQYKVCNITEMSDFESVWLHPRLESARKRLYHGDRGFFPCNVCNSTSMRVGLLPDRMGREQLSDVEDRDRQITEYPYSSDFVRPVKREWEK